MGIHCPFYQEDDFENAFLILVDICRCQLLYSQISSRLDRMEEDMQTKARDYAHSRLTEHNGDPFLYESQPLLAEGPTSGSLPHALTFDLRKGSQTFDALSSSQSLEPYQQQSHQMNWDLLDLGIQDQTSVPYERFGEDARLLSEVKTSTSLEVDQNPCIEICSNAIHNRTAQMHESSISHSSR